MKKVLRGLSCCITPGVSATKSHPTNAPPEQKPQGGAESAAAGSARAAGLSLDAESAELAGRDLAVLAVLNAGISSTRVSRGQQQSFNNLTFPSRGLQAALHWVSPALLSSLRTKSAEEVAR